MLTDEIQIGGAIGNIHRNAPSVILNYLSIFSVMGLLAAIMLVAQPLLRDADLHRRAILQRTGEQGQLPVGARARRRNCSARDLRGHRALHDRRFVHAVAGPEADRTFMIEPDAWAFGVLVVPNLIFISAFLLPCSRSRRAGCWWCSSVRWRC